ncbi:MAG: metal ABC transporter substrate-binding protein [Chthoniobacterales bacterium]|jgi:zinc transport system substrate-binding protein
MILSIFTSRKVMAVLAATFFSSPAQAAPPLRVVTSFYPIYVATLNVTAGVEGVVVENLASPHVGCLHDYQLTPGAMRVLSEANLLLVNGAGMESFLAKVSQQLPGLRVVGVSEGIPLLDGNPHVWVGLEGAQRQVENIAVALASADPAHAAEFRAKADKYIARLTALEARMHAVLAPYAGTPVITFHEAFPYFARDFNLRVVGVIEREPGAEPSARELADMIDLVRREDVKVLLAEPQYPHQSADVIARETGARVYELDPVVTGPAEPTAAREAYCRAMEQNLTVLQEALR